MIESVVILLLCGLIGYQEHNNRKERTKLINALMAKNANEMVNMTLADQTKIEPEKIENPISDLIDSSDMSNEQFDDFIKQQVS